MRWGVSVGKKIYSENEEDIFVYSHTQHTKRYNNVVNKLRIKWLDEYNGKIEVFILECSTEYGKLVNVEKFRYRAEDFLIMLMFTVYV